jgi:transposase
MKKNSKWGVRKSQKKQDGAAGAYTIGLDLGDKNSQYCVLDGAGEIVAEGRVSTSGAALEQQLKSYRGSVVALEAGTHSGWVSRKLKQLGLETVVANPRKVRLIAESTQKSDPEDARMLARLARVDRRLLFEIHHRSEAAQLDLTVIRARAGLVEARTKLVNTLRGLAKTLGSRLKKCDAEVITVEVLDGLPEGVKAALTPLAVQIQTLTLGIGEYDQRIAVMGNQYPETARLKQVSGVGDLIALTYVLTLGDKDRFERSRDVGCYLGMVSKRRNSSESQPELSISKEGDTYLRSLLVQGAHYILSRRGPDTDLKRWGLRLAERGEDQKSRKSKGKKAKRRAVVAVARKLGVLLHRLWVSGEQYEPLRQALQQQQAA